MKFDDILKRFKTSEEPENIVPLLEDSSLRNGIVAWKSVVIARQSEEDCTLKDETSRWNWLWSRVVYDPELFGVVAGVKSQEAISLLQRLIGLRLIYPDGTMNEHAKSYLQSIIFEKLSKGKKPKPEPKPEPKKSDK